jgi:hypothetical protein
MSKRTPGKWRALACTVLVILAAGAVPSALAEEKVIIAYGGHC